MKVIEPAANGFAAYEVDRNASPPVRELLKQFNTCEEAVSVFPSAMVKSVSTALDHRHALERHKRSEAATKVRRTKSEPSSSTPPSY